MVRLGESFTTSGGVRDKPIGLIGNASLKSAFHFLYILDYRYRMNYDLKKILDDRNLDLNKCIKSTDDIMQQLAMDVFSGTHIDQLQVALISSVMNVADLYRCKKFSILLLKSALAQLESENFIETGGKLN